MYLAYQMSTPYQKVVILPSDATGTYKNSFNESKTLDNQAKWLLLNLV